MPKQYGYHNPFPKQLAREHIAQLNLPEPDRDNARIARELKTEKRNKRLRERYASLLAPADQLAKPEPSGRRVRVNLFGRY